mmetsp:Transcript_57388/g.91252  ORF Transcript_57388/g.91252 Transcript_57388/m.91252 type:complete len:264 (+) Transcript_57388:3088-3879(+)
MTSLETVIGSWPSSNCKLLFFMKSSVPLCFSSDAAAGVSLRRCLCKELARSRKRRFFSIAKRCISMASLFPLTGGAGRANFPFPLQPFIGGIGGIGPLPIISGGGHGGIGPLPGGMPLPIIGGMPFPGGIGGIPGGIGGIPGGMPFPGGIPGMSGGNIIGGMPGIPGGMPGKPGGMPGKPGGIPCIMPPSFEDSEPLSSRFLFFSSLDSCLLFFFAFFSFFPSFPSFFRFRPSPSPPPPLLAASFSWASSCPMFSSGSQEVSL